MQEIRAGLRKTAFALGLLGAGAVGVLAPSELPSADDALRGGFKVALGDARAGWGDAGDGGFSLASDHGRDARLWLGSGEAAWALDGRSLRVGERIVVRGGEGRLAAFDVRSVGPVDGAFLATSRPLLLVVLQPAFNPDAAPVRLIVEAGEAAPGAAAARPRTL